MADSEDVLLNIVMSGQEAVVSALTSIGRAGRDAFNALQSASSTASRNLNDVSISAQRANRNLEATANSADKSADSLKRTADRATEAGAAVEKSSGFLARLGKDTLIIGAGIAALATAIAANASHAASSILSISGAAKDAGVDLENFQVLQYTLSQVGLSGTEATNVITKFANNLSNAGDHAAAAEKKMAALNVQLSNIRATHAAFVAKNEDIKFLDQLANPELVATPDQLQKLREYQSQLAQIVAIEDQLDEQQKKLDTANLLQNLKVGDNTLDSFKRAAELIASIKDDTERADLSTKIFGVDLSDQLEGGAASVQKFVERFHALVGEGTTKDMFRIAREYRSAVDEFKLVNRIGSEQLGSIFLPYITQGISKFNDLMSMNQKVIGNWLDYVKEKVAAGVDALSELFSQATQPSSGQQQQSPRAPAVLMQASFVADDAQQQLRPVETWFDRLKNIAVSVGSSIGSIVKNVIVPAFATLSVVSTRALQAVNEFFQSKLTIADVGIAGLLTYLTGGFKTLAVAALAAFGSIASDGINNFKTALEALGITFDNMKKSVASFLSDMQTAFSGALGKDILQGMIPTAKTLTQAILAIAAAFVVVRTGAGLLAPVLERVIGKETLAAIGIKGLSGEAVLFAAIVGQLTGVTKALSTVLIAVASAMSLFVNTLNLAKQGLLSIAALVGWPALLVVGITTAIIFFEKFQSLLQPIADLLNTMFGTNFFTGANLAVAIIGTMTIALVGLTASALSASGAFGILGTGLAALGTLLAPILPEVIAIGAALAVAYALYHKEINTAIAKTLDFSTTTKQATNDTKDAYVSMFDSISEKISQFVSKITGAQSKAADAIKAIKPLPAFDDQTKKDGQLYGGPTPIDFLVGGKLGPQVANPFVRAEDESGAGGLFGAATNIMSAFSKAKESATSNLNAIGETGAAAGNKIAESMDKAAKSVEKLAKQSGGLTVAQMFANDFGAKFQPSEKRKDEVSSTYSSFFTNLGTLLAKVPESLAAVGGAQKTTMSVDPVSIWIGIKELLAQINQKLGANKGDVEAHEQGGLLGGRSGRDTNLGLFTRGEYIHPVKAVRHYGLGFMNAVRTMRLPKFEMGGMVGGFSFDLGSSARVPRYEIGGPVASVQSSSGRPLVLDFGGGRRYSGMTVSDDTASKLQGYAIDRSRRSTGQPGWMD